MGLLMAKSADEKVTLIQTWFGWFFMHTDTFEGELGESLAYLWPAIAQGTTIEVSPNDAIVQCLERAKIPSDSIIWKYIDIVAD